MVGRRVAHEVDELIHMIWSLAGDVAELGQVSAQRIDQLGPLPDQQIAGAEDHRRRLRFGALGLNEAHGRPLRGLAMDNEMRERNRQAWNAGRYDA